MKPLNFIEFAKQLGRLLVRISFGIFLKDKLTYFPNLSLKIREM